MKRKAAVSYMTGCLLLFVISLFFNREYFYRLSYDNLILYQLKQAAGVLVLYGIGYCFMKLIQDYFSDLWVALLAMPCGAALWVLAGQAMLLLTVTYKMHRVFVVIALLLLALFIIRRKTGRTGGNGMIGIGGIKGLLPSPEIILVVAGTAFLVSTGWNYINMNYDSYLYFADYGRMIAACGDYREWNNTADAFVITNIGQFLPLLNSYTAFWGLEYCLPELSFLVCNMLAVFAAAVYEHTGDIMDRGKRIGYTALFTAALATCTCVAVFANWMLSNAFIMYYLTIAGILGTRAPVKMKTDYAIVISGCGLAVTMLRKDGIIVVCFLFLCYCCSHAAQAKRLAGWLLPAALAQFGYIAYVRLFLGTETHTARGTSILSNKFVFLLALAVTAAFVYFLWLHPYFEKWFGTKLMPVLLALMVGTALAAAASTFWKSVDHIEAVLKILVSPAYGFSILLWLLLLAIILSKPVKVDYGIFLIIGYCILTFLIYWNKGNTEQGIDNSGMRTFVQIVPMIFYVESVYLKDRLFADNYEKTRIGEDRSNGNHSSERRIR